MSYEIDFRAELIVNRIRFGSSFFEYEGRSADTAGLQFEVRSLLTPENARDVTGEISFQSEENYRTRPPELYSGYWFFSTPEHFMATIQISPKQMNRLWQTCSARPEWLSISIEQGPAVPKLDTRYEGKFRLSYNAGYTRHQ